MTFQAHLKAAQARNIQPPEGFTQEEWALSIAAVNSGFDGFDTQITKPDRIMRQPLGCQLYRHFDADGVLLYVGVSLSTLHRLANHKSVAHWFWRISMVTIEHFETRDEASIAETLAIANERPLYNVEKKGKAATRRILPD